MATQPLRFGFWACSLPKVSAHVAELLPTVTQVSCHGRRPLCIVRLPNCTPSQDSAALGKEVKPLLGNGFGVSHLTESFEQLSMRALITYCSAECIPARNPEEI